MGTEDAMAVRGGIGEEEEVAAPFALRRLDGRLDEAGEPWYGCLDGD